MPLTTSLRDEENERINNILKRLIGLDYVPETASILADEILQELGLTFEILSVSSSEEIIELLQSKHFDWENTEQFADFLISVSDRSSKNLMNWKQKAIAIYNHIQIGSKVFSFGISNKIASEKR